MHQFGTATAFVLPQYANHIFASIVWVASEAVLSQKFRGDHNVNMPTSLPLGQWRSVWIGEFIEHKAWGHFLSFTDDHL